MLNLLYKLVLLFVISTATLVPVTSQASSISEYKIKAAFIYNFARFTTWQDDSDELRVCVYGDDPFGPDLARLDGKTAADRTIRIVRTKVIEEIKSCHVAFLNIIPPERRLYKRALDELRGANILTISEADEALDFGVMIQLRIDNNRIVFDVNHSSAKSSNIEISAKLLRLASEVL